MVKKSQAGRPKKLTGPASHIGAVVELSLIERLDDVADTLGMSRSEAMRHAIERLVASSDVPKQQEQLPVAI